MRRTVHPGVLIMILAAGLAATAARADEVTFTFEPPEDLASTFESVSLRGSFNAWGETAMERQDDGTWTLTLTLDPGEYEYKFFINGEWPQDMSTWLQGGPVDPNAHGYTDDGHGGQNAIVIVGEGAAAPREEFEPAPPREDGHARIHYHRPKGGYAGWGLHAWGDTEEVVEWTSPLTPSGQDNYGLYWDVRLTEGAHEVGFIIHKGDTKDPGPDMFLEIGEHGEEIWLVSGSSTIHTEEPDVSLLAFGDLTRARAHWLDRSTIVWRVRANEGDAFRLHASRDADLAITTEGLAGGETVDLVVEPTGIPRDILARFPHLIGYTALRLPEGDLSRVPGLLKGQLAVSVTSSEGRLRDATGVQIPGVLDDLFAYDGPLGLTWDDGVPTISLWAPTAQAVSLQLYGNSGVAEPAVVVEMAERNGVWTATGEPEWEWKYYTFGVTVFTPVTGRVETNTVTDPYSRSLSRNSARSQIVDFANPQITPEGWADIVKPPLEAPEDIVIYELHVRDFSSNDVSCPPSVVGTYMAFVVETEGRRHLAALAEAGLTHVHLLPVFDIASVDENKATWQVTGDISAFPPDSDQQQAAVSRISGSDAYNWGYDPYHYGVPEGSYSTVPDSPRRIAEFREMVKALSGMGLRVIMDVVYNHTHASGVDDKSVLDKVVPGYYHRLNADGFVETSTCCQNTATEHYMMERLMIDDLVHWAVDYKVDGFRFDLMGHHMKRNMEKARDALRSLTVEEHGVDGESIYLYGEGWDFGEVQGNRRGVNATQPNMTGTGIGCFNDRIRDAVRGGSAFSDRREQGFATGLFLDPNGYNRGGGAERQKLLASQDRIRIGMAGNLRNFAFIDHQGRETDGWRFDNVGFAGDPQEALNYVSAHDNETFFDKIQYSAASDATMDDRVRMQNLGLSVVALGQGIPFFHAGSDMLRSKSLDADSYNSGDWFNAIDWGYQSNNFGVGLPVAEKNRDRWNIIGPLLAREDITPGREEIMKTVHHFREMLKIRKSSPLFRLRTAEDVIARVRFHNTGVDQTPGLIVMSISDEAEGLRPIDPENRGFVVLLNAAKESVEFRHDDWLGQAFELHPVLVDSHDPVVGEASFDPGWGSFTVPARTAAVFALK
jgi:pullulanase-type alpha-1,6-glucosidase